MWLIAGGVALLLLVIVAAGAALWISGVSARLAPTPEVAAALDKQLDPETGGPTHYLALAEYRPIGDARPVAAGLVLVTVDRSNHKATVLSIPAATLLSTSTAGTQTVDTVYGKGGPAATVATVKKLTGLPVNHYVRLDFMGLVLGVDSIGGVRMNVDRAVDNSHLGLPPEYLVSVKPGFQTLSGMQALVYLKDQTGSDSAKRQPARQMAFLTAMLKQLGAVSNLPRLPEILSSLSENVTTDMGVPQLVELVATFRGVDKKDMTRETLPGHYEGAGRDRIYKLGASAPATSGPAAVEATASQAATAP